MFYTQNFPYFHLRCKWEIELEIAGYWSQQSITQLNAATTLRLKAEVLFELYNDYPVFPTGTRTCFAAEIDGDSYPYELTIHPKLTSSRSTRSNTANGTINNYQTNY